MDYVPQLSDLPLSTSIDHLDLAYQQLISSTIPYQATLHVVDISLNFPRHRAHDF